MTTDNLKFYYFYSPTYNFFHEQIQDKLGNYVELIPFKIDDITEKSSGHHFEGLTIKLELVIKVILENIGNTIVFSDATIFIHSNNNKYFKDYIKQYNEYDLVLIDEPYNKNYNIGLLTIKCSDKTLNFFKEALLLVETKQINHDQPAINYLLKNKETNITFTTYDNKIYCDFFREQWRDEFIIYKSFISNTNKKDNFNQRIQLFYNTRLIDKETFNKWYIV